MYTKKSTDRSTKDSLAKINKIKEVLKNADAVVVGAGAGLSTSAGFTYAGGRFEKNFADFIAKYHFTDMYTAGFYRFSTLEEQWAFWSRFIAVNRYADAKKPVYAQLLHLLQGKDYFVITTNVDHQFQKAGIPHERLFYTQGDYGLWQCSEPCHQKTYDNEAAVKAMVSQQKEMRIPSSLIPHCPVCGKPMSMNLRADDTFVEDEGWHQAQERYHEFLRKHQTGNTVYLELGVGWNTPVIIKYPFWQLTQRNKDASYICINQDVSEVPEEIEKQSICIHEDIGAVLQSLEN